MTLVQPSLGTGKFGLGWLPDMPDARDWLYAVPAGPPPTLPSVIDLRPQAYPRPAYNQSSSNSCTANAVAAMFGFIDRKQGGANINPSRRQIYYDARLYDGLQTIDRGAYIRSALRAVAERGAAPEELFPYDVARINERPPQSVYEAAQLKQAIGYYRVNIDVDSMRQCLAEGFPLVLGTTLYENYYEAANNGMVPMPAGSVIGGHAQEYIGYDDSLRRFIVQGSWGEFGDQGFVYIPYDYAANENYSADGWTLRSVEEQEERPIPPDPNHYLFSAILAVVKPGKLVLDAMIKLPSLRGRRIRISTGTLIIDGKIKSSDDTVLVVKGEFDNLLTLRGGTVQVETVE